ncbi:glycoside hydrolase family 28 protein [Hypholoma sublateritium FD-334 SS-4]|uniref:galacturonan 1,4-alpha-galacturonidase n=1 Tax=Hypholoma sublateritium (strain FD-334 SS-4) TaxID=945553 RepID=A0A0D2MMU5_HYPSF|nr:glycoside hydrolase family 28 protein [Hypholoma sublateritium FD-334 SS-4]
MMKALLSVFCALLSLTPALGATLPGGSHSQNNCELRPLGPGRDDTDQVEAAIAKCGHFGTTTFAEGSYNITRKMTWDLVSAKVDLKGYLNFPPDIDFWLNANNTYRVVFIQSQASWFVVTGSDFEVDAHNKGGIQGNGQPWWTYFATHTREDGDGRPISLTLFKVTRGTISNFRIQSPPFWSNAVAESSDVVYNGMFINATNTNPLYAGQNIVPNTDGIDTYRSDRVSLLNWDVTCGDDCIAVKGNSTNIELRNITCRGGNGIAIGSLGQYINMPDYVNNVEMDTLQMIRLDPSVQPNMGTGVYFKSFDGSVNGSPPTAGGGANVVDIACSPAAICDDISFENFNVAPPAGEAPRLICQNTANVTGLTGSDALQHLAIPLVRHESGLAGHAIVMELGKSRSF